MANEDQAQADSTDETTAVDPLDATDSQNGTNELAAYEADRDAMLDALSQDDTQGDEPAESEDEQEQADQSDSEEEFEEQESSDEDGDDPEEVEQEPETKESKRFRFNNAEDQAVAAIAKARKCTLVEAARIYAGDSATATKHQEEQADFKKPQERESSESVTSAIKELQTKKKEFLSSLDFESAADLEEQIDELRDKRYALKLDEERDQSLKAQENEREYHDAFRKSEGKAIQFYPDAAVLDSPLAKEMARLDAEMTEMDDPLCGSPDRPFIIAKEAAKNLGIPMKKPGTAPAKKTVQHRPIQPAGGNARTSSTDANTAFRTDLDGLDDLDAYNEYAAKALRG